MSQLIAHAIELSMPMIERVIEVVTEILAGLLGVPIGNDVTGSYSGTSGSYT